MPDSPAVSFAHTRIGWAGGVGIEGAVSGNWTAKAEYLHIDLGSTTDAFNFGFVAFANTQYYKNRVSGGVIGYPWRDNFCENRSYGVSTGEVRLLSPFPVMTFVGIAARVFM